MNINDITDDLNALGTLVTGKEPSGAQRRFSAGSFIGGEMFYCSHDGGYTRFRFQWLDEPTDECAGLIMFIWNGEKGQDLDKRLAAWNSLEVAVARVTLEKALADLVGKMGE